MQSVKFYVDFPMFRHYYYYIYTLHQKPRPTNSFAQNVAEEFKLRECKFCVSHSQFTKFSQLAIEPEPVIMT